ncbi:MAG TPA: UDP-N-acetylglucosamine 2-epimerase (non-hydrolyzing) [Solirubrobacterales bacterium]|nr:UDP-N-acetylglucosamine 2-epimerase (non-hydrolyzing) [Solirubrobacterales bacterium]
MEPGRRTVLTVVGNRPQFVKAAAVSEHLRERVDEILVHTGQHYDPELSDVFFEQLEMPAPDRELEVGSGSHAEQTAEILSRLEPLVSELEPDALLVYGDTNSTLGGALIAAKGQVPLIHVEAGMRSGDRTMPEEINRLVVDSLGGLLLCSTETALRNLRDEGRDPHAVVTGDVMADVALTFGSVADERSRVLAGLGLEPGRFIVATAHRPGNVDDPERLTLVVEVLARAAETAPVVFPAHPRTRARLEEIGALDGLPDRGITPVEPLGYLDFTRLVRAARAVITDSGGLQKEAFLASVPCLTMRDETEWVETVEAGWNLLIGLHPEAVADALAELPKPGDDSPAAELYGSGLAGERVAAAIADWLA